MHYMPIFLERLSDRFVRVFNKKLQCNVTDILMLSTSKDIQSWLVVKKIEKGCRRVVKTDCRKVFSFEYEYIRTCNHYNERSLRDMKNEYDGERFNLSSDQPSRQSSDLYFDKELLSRHAGGVTLFGVIRITLNPNVQPVLLYVAI